MNGSDDWARLGHVIEDRISDLRLTQADVQARGGPSPATVRAIVNGRSTTLSPSKRRDLERALSWMEGSIDTVLAGGDATVKPRSRLANYLNARDKAPDERTAEEQRAVVETQSRLDLDRQAAILTERVNRYSLLIDLSDRAVDRFKSGNTTELGETLHQLQDEARAVAARDVGVEVLDAHLAYQARMKELVAAHESGDEERVREWWAEVKVADEEAPAKQGDYDLAANRSIDEMSRSEHINRESARRGEQPDPDGPEFGA